MQWNAAAPLLLLLAAALLGAPVQKVQAQEQGVPADLEGCPQWLLSYIKFHNEQRNNASALRLFVHDDGQGSMGYGDRIRATVHSLRAAASSGRLQHVVSRFPIDLERVFRPNHLDWRPVAGHELSSAGTRLSQDNFHHLKKTVINETVKLVYWFGNPYCSWDPPTWTDPSRWANISKDRIGIDRDCGCIFRAMFKPSDELSKLIDEEQARVLPNGTVNFTAVHYRVYTGMRGEGEGAPEKDRLPFNLTNHTAFMKTLQCIKEKTGNLTVFIAASDVNARRAIKQGMLPGVVGPSQEWAIHPASMATDNATLRPKPDEHIHTFVELGMLARGTYGVWSSSGFSNVARWMQGKGPEWNLIVDPRQGERGAGCWTFKEIGGPGGV